MLLQKANWRLGYHQIISDCRPSAASPGGTVLILCNPDADALCAARILSYALRADKIPYQLRPCGGFARLKYILRKLDLNPLQEHDEDHHHNDEQDEFRLREFMASAATVRTVILLNLGAMHNLQRELFEPTQHVDANGQSHTSKALLHVHLTKVFILDSHRPYHLNNIHAGHNIILWNDYDNWHDSTGGIPSDGDDLSGNESSDDEEEEEEDDGESLGEDETSKNNSDSEGEAEFDDGSVATEEAEVSRASRQDSVVDETDEDADDEIENEVEDAEDDENDHDDEDDIEPSSSKRRSKDTSPHSKSKRQRSDPTTPETEADSDVENDSESTSSKPTAPLTSTQTSMGIRERHQDRKDRIKRYYSAGSFHSSPIALMAYDLLAGQLRHQFIGDLLWLACVGVADAFLHHRLDVIGYVKVACELEEHVENIYPSSANDKLKGFASVDGMKIALSQNGKIIRQKDELNFFLLRHTSLFEAMVLSPDLNARMELWRSSGMKKLRELLASMGLPLAQCQQPYAFMKPSLKRKLKEEIMIHEEEYNLHHLRHTAFLRVCGYKSMISASDMAHAVTALLECDVKSGDKDSLDSVHVPEESPFQGEDDDEEDRTLMASFNVAYDALNSNGSSALSLSGDFGGHIEGGDLSSIVNGGDSSGTGLGSGIRLAISVQKAIISTAVSLVERKAINRLSHFRYAYLNATSNGTNGSNQFSAESSKETQTHIFSKPLALTRLAHFLLDMHKSNGKWSGARALPLVLIAEKPQTQSYIVAGFEFSETRNEFKQRFENAASSMEGDIKFDSFDSNIVEIRSELVGRFIESLHYLIDSSTI